MQADRLFVRTSEKFNATASARPTGLGADIVPGSQVPTPEVLN